MFAGGNENLKEKFDRLIQLAKDHGTLDAMIRKWINEK